MRTRSERYDAGVSTGAQRYDLGKISKVERTPQGFLRVTGVAGHVGIQEYRNPNGTKRRELRTDEVVFDPRSLRGFDGASLTNDHPVEHGEHVMVTPANVRKFEVGTVMGPGRRDGADVVVDTIWKDPIAMDAIERKRKVALSVGYNVDLDETPGVHPVYGAYDAIQRNIVVNHLALVDAGRAPRAKLRVDARLDYGMAVGVGMAKLTTIVQGHQHTVDPDCTTTSWATSEGSDTGHDHTVVRNQDGTISLTENAGHTHTIISPLNTDRRIDMDEIEKLKETIRVINDKLSKAETEAGAAVARASAEKLRADTAEGRVMTLESSNKDLTAKLASTVAATETEAFRAEKLRADSLAERVANFDNTFDTRVRSRTELVRQVLVVMGPKFRTDDLNDRQLRTAVIKRLDAAAAIDEKTEEGIVIGRYLSLVEKHGEAALSQANIEATLASQNRADSRNGARDEKGQSLLEKKKAYRDQWKQPLPNSKVRVGG